MNLFLLILLMIECSIFASKPCDKPWKRARAKKQDGVLILKFHYRECAAGLMRSDPLESVKVETPDLDFIIDDEDIIERITVSSTGEYIKEVTFKGKKFTYSNSKNPKIMQEELDLQERSFRARKPNVIFAAMYGTFRVEQNNVGKDRPSLWKPLK